MLAVFKERIEKGEAAVSPKGVNILNFDGSQMISSPRSIEACRAEGIVPSQLMPTSTDDIHYTPNFRSKRKLQAEKTRQANINRCIKRFHELCAAAEKAIANGGNNDIDKALHQRENHQRQKYQKTRQVKERMLENMINDQLRTQQARAAALEKVAEKEALIQKKKAAREAKLESESARKMKLAEERRQIVQQELRRAFEENQQRFAERTAAVAASQERLLAQRNSEMLARKEAAARRKDELNQKRESCLADQRARVEHLLEKRQLVEKQLQRVLKERDARMREKLDDITLRNLTIQEHVQRVKAVEQFNKEQAVDRIESKMQRANRLAAIKEKIIKGQQQINVKDREKRVVLATWKAGTEITGDYSIPQELREYLSDRVTVPPKQSALVLIPDRTHHSKWVWNDEHV